MSKLGEMDLGVFPFRFVADNLSIADEPAFRTDKPFVQTQQLGVSLKLTPTPAQSRQDRLAVLTKTFGRPHQKRARGMGLFLAA